MVGIRLEGDFVMVSRIINLVSSKFYLALLSKYYFVDISLRSLNPWISLLNAFFKKQENRRVRIMLAYSVQLIFCILA